MVSDVKLPLGPPIRWTLSTARERSGSCATGASCLHSISATSRSAHPRDSALSTCFGCSLTNTSSTWSSPTAHQTPSSLHPVWYVDSRFSAITLCTVSTSCCSYPRNHTPGTANAARCITVFQSYVWHQLSLRRMMHWTGTLSIFLIVPCSRPASHGPHRPCPLPQRSPIRSVCTLICLKRCATNSYF